MAPDLEQLAERPATNAVRRMTGHFRNSTSSTEQHESSVEAKTQRAQEDKSRLEDSLEVSTMSLSSFVSLRPQLFWPSTSGMEKEGPLLLDEDRVDPPLAVQEPQSYRGSSGNTTVYSARVLKADGYLEHIAIKKLPLRENEGDDGLPIYPDLKELKSELNVLGRLRHPHIIVALGSFVQNGTESRQSRFAMLLFPLAERDMEQFLRRISKHNARRHGRDTWKAHYKLDKLLSYFACLCKTMSYLHSQNVKHRDIKPENILIDAYGEVLLADFGLARFYADGETVHTSGYRLSTIKYAPRGVLNEDVRGFESDIISLGYCFLRMATVVFGETIKSHEDAMGDRSYAEFVDEANAASDWMDKLEMGCAILKHDQWPKARFDAAPGASVKEFFVHIKTMMSAKPSTHEADRQLLAANATDLQRLPNEKILVDACKFFRLLCAEPRCTGCADPPARSTSSSFASSTWSPTPHGIVDARQGSTSSSSTVLSNHESQQGHRPQPAISVRSPSGHIENIGSGSSLGLERDVIYEEPATFGAVENMMYEEQAVPGVVERVRLEEPQTKTDRPTSQAMPKENSEEPVTTAKRQSLTPSTRASPLSRTEPLLSRAARESGSGNGVTHRDSLDGAAGSFVIVYDPSKERYSIVRKSKLWVTYKENDDWLRGYLIGIRKGKWIALDDGRGNSKGTIDPGSKYGLLLWLRVVTRLVFVPMSGRLDRSYV